MHFMFLLNIPRYIYYYFFPRRCIVCGRIVNPGLINNLCGECRKKIPTPFYVSLSNQSFCSKCSRILISEDQLCTVCRNRDYLFIRNISIWRYSDQTVRQLIHNYKFRNFKSASLFLSDKISEFYFTLYSGYAVIPVPCSRKRLKNKGWDHMEIISRHLINRKIPVFSVLKRRHGTEQKKLSSYERLSNINSRFYIKKNFKTVILNSFRGILIIDDIFTTGATVNECTRTILKSVKNNNIHILTIALD